MGYTLTGHMGDTNLSLGELRLTQGMGWFGGGFAWALPRILSYSQEGGERSECLLVNNSKCGRHPPPSFVMLHSGARFDPLVLRLRL